MKKCHKLILSIHLHQHQSCECPQTPEPVQRSSAAQKNILFPALLQDKAVDYSYHQVKHHTFTGHHSVPGCQPVWSILQLFFLAFYARYTPLSRITTTEQLPAEFPLQLSRGWVCKRLFRELKEKRKTKNLERIVIQISVKLITTSEVM